MRDIDSILDILDLDPEDREWAEDRYLRDEWTCRISSRDETVERPWRHTSLTRRCSSDRLQRLFDAFAARLLSGQLAGWRVEARYFVRPSYIACTYLDERCIVVDLSRVKSDRDVRRVLLHEMCHAATPGDQEQHGELFHREANRLRRLGLRSA